MNSNRSLKKQTLTLVIILLVAVLAIGVMSPAVAYYIRRTEKSVGEYEPGKPATPGITNPQPAQTQRITFLSDTETSLDNLYIQIPDQGYPVYVRVAVVVTWLKPADCTCTQPVCGAHVCKDCLCDGCKECETCVKGLLCEDCEKCDHIGDVKNCPDCVEVDCDKCENCVDSDCEDCQQEGGCVGCANCSKLVDDKCGKCVNCETYCLDRDECPHCNDDDNDDWDVIFPQPTEGENKDYLLTVGDKWEKQDNSPYYYHKEAVTSSGEASGSVITVDWSTNTPFIKSFERLSTAALPITIDGLDVKDCVLKVEIRVQTVQAVGSTDKSDNIDKEDEIPAWKDAWSDGLSTWPDSGQH